MATTFASVSFSILIMYVLQDDPAARGISSRHTQPTIGRKSPGTPPEHFGRRPADYLVRQLDHTAYGWHDPGFSHVDVQFKAANNTSLNGWICESKCPLGFILYCHDGTGNISTRSEILKSIHDELRATVFMFDYRGCGKSDGVLSLDSDIQLDTIAALTFFLNRYGITPKDVTLFMEQEVGSHAATMIPKRNMPFVNLTFIPADLVDNADDKPFEIDRSSVFGQLILEAGLSPLVSRLSRQRGSCWFVQAVTWPDNDPRVRHAEGIVEGCRTNGLPSFAKMTAVCDFLRHSWKTVKDPRAGDVK